MEKEKNMLAAWREQKTNFWRNLMFKRLKSTGINLMVLVVAVLVFAGSF